MSESALVSKPLYARHPSLRKTWPAWMLGDYSGLPSIGESPTAEDENRYDAWVARTESTEVGHD